MLLSITTLLFLCLQVHSQFLITLNASDPNGCGKGEEFRQGTCKLCPPGTYRFLGPSTLPNRALFQCLTLEQSYESKPEPSTDKCVKCPSGTYNPYAGVVSGIRCLPCPPGTRSHTGARQCFKCPGQRSSAQGSPVCGNCPKGFFLTKPCTASNRPKSICSKCPRGFYSAQRNSLSCTKCPPGSSTATRGAVSKNMCKPCGSNGVRCSCRSGSEPWNQVEFFRPIGNAECIRCPPGTRARNPFATSIEQCIPCPINTIHLFQRGCVKCAVGKRTFGRGANGCRATKAAPCPFGLFKGSDVVCKQCPAGYKRMGRSCMLWPPGTTSPGFDRPSCDMCIFPEVAYDSRTSSCGCARNYFRDDSSFRCLPCPRGRGIDLDVHNQNTCDVNCTVLPHHASCKPCAKDFGRDLETKACTRCPDGLISP